MILTDASFRNKVIQELLKQHPIEHSQENEISNVFSQEEEESSESSNTTSNTSVSFKWSNPAIKLLLNSYLEEKENFRDPKFKKAILWQRIAKKMMASGYNLSSEACDKKFRNLKVTYKTIKDNAKQTGRGRQHWEFFYLMEDIFSNDATINTPHTISSMNVCSTLNSYDENLPGPSTLQTTAISTGNEPSTSKSATNTTENKNKRAHNRNLEDFRKKFLSNQQMQNKYLADMKELYLRHVNVQEDRNKVLQNILNHLENQQGSKP